MGGIRSEKRTFQDDFIVDKQDSIIEQLVRLNGLINFDYDSGEVTRPDAVTENYIFKLNNVTVGTIQIVYTDSTKENILSFARI